MKVVSQYENVHVQINVSNKDREKYQTIRPLKCL